MMLRMLVSSLAVMAIIAATLFVGAGTVDFWQAWLYVALALACHLYMMADLAKRDPALLARRRKAGARAEPRMTQKVLIRLLILIWIMTPVVAAWDRRRGWSDLPVWLNLLGAALFLAGQILMLQVFRANSFARATVEVSEGQTVCDTGPYAIVRHPMYLAMVVAGGGAALLLNSWWALLLAMFNLPVLALRLLDEERVMAEELPGYSAYRDKVHRRLIPGIW